MCRNVVNAAGLYAPHIATRISGVPAPSIPPSHFAKGNYFSLEGPSPFSMLVYPVRARSCLARPLAHARRACRRGSALLVHTLAYPGPAHRLHLL